MHRSIIVLLWLLILTVILLSVPTKCKLGNKPEHFTDYYGFYKQYCPTCGFRSKKGCMSCTNCGFCTTATGHSKCEPGDSNGPYFREDCAAWEYGDPYFYHPGANVYPIVQMRNMYPYTKWNVHRSPRQSRRGKRLG